jgi:hypothetical protein
MGPLMRLMPLLLLSAACTSQLTVHGDPQTQTDQRVTVSGSTAGVQLVAYDGREAPYQLPATYDSDQLTLIARHMGVHFFEKPNAVVQSGGALELSIDTVQLHDDGYFPFSQAYCQQVGLGSSHFILGQEMNKTEVRPWLGGGGALNLAVDAQLPTSQLVVHDGSQYVSRSDLVNGGDAPISQMSFFVYLTDLVHGNIVAVLFNLYDPRGPYGHFIGNDHHTFFYSTSLDPTLSSDFTIVSGAHHHEPFGWDTVKVRIDADQLKSVLKQFPQDQPLSLDPNDYRLDSFGLLNEMNFLYADAANCIAAFDPNTSAKVDFGLRNLVVDVEPGPTAWRGANDGVSAVGLVRGWACEVGSDVPVTVRLSAGGQTLADVIAFEPGEAAIGQLCASGPAHRFSYQVRPGQLAGLAGQTVSAAVIDSGAPVLALQTFAGVNYALPGTMQQPPPQAKTFEGWNEGLSAGEVVNGWACQVGSDAPVTVRLFAGGQALADVVADLAAEPAVGQQCSSGPSHRFAYAVTAAQLAAFAGQTVSAAVIDQGAPVFTLNASADASYTLPAAMPPPPPPVELTGMLEGVFLSQDNHVWVQGWACVKGSPTPAVVEVPGVGTVTANQASEWQVGAACGEATGGHRWSIDLSASQVSSLAGHSLTANIRDAALTQQLALPSAGAWPTDVPSFLGGFDGVGSDGVVRGWACAVGRDAPVQVTLQVGDTVLAAPTASEAAEALVGTLCNSGSAHRFTVQLSPQQISTFSGQRVVAQVDVAGESAYTLQTFDGIVYSVP